MRKDALETAAVGADELSLGLEMDLRMGGICGGG
jgi:hypothetical protein